MIKKTYNQDKKYFHSNTKFNSVPQTCEILNHPSITNASYMKKKLRITQNIQSTEKMLKILQLSKKTVNNNICGVQNYVISGEMLSIDSECFHHTLEQQLSSTSEQIFSNEEIDNIFFSIIKALISLEQIGMGHGCLSFKDIVLSAEGQIKLMHPCLASQSPFERVEGYFYSPELLQINNKPYCNPNKQIDIIANDIFVAALIVIQCAIRQPITNCYNYYYGTLDSTLLTKMYHKFDKNYLQNGGQQNSIVLNLLSSMVEYKRINRITLKQIISQIEQQFSYSDEQNNENSQQIASFLLSKGQSSIPVAEIEGDQSMLMDYSVGIIKDTQIL